MESSTQVILSGVLTFGVPLLFACRELMALRRRPGGSWGGNGPPEPPPERPPPDASPMKPLPECLIPKPMSSRPMISGPLSEVPQRRRVLEPV